MQSIAKTRKKLMEGLVIPAHPLALTPSRRLDEDRQRGLTRYYLAAGAGGVAVGVHTTQFRIHDPKVGLLRPVLELAAEESERFDALHGGSTLKVAGLVGSREQCLREASLAADLGYDCVLLSPSGFASGSDSQLLDCARAAAEILPLFGFYLQPAVGGRSLCFEFWKRFSEIDNLTAIKIAPFDRYRTLDVARAVAESGRADQIALYTGNDDNILLDLLMSYAFPVNGQTVTLRMRGGLLGHWAVWTRKAVEIFDSVKRLNLSGEAIPQELLTLAAQITDANAAIFDARNRFRGCIPGILEVLRRCGLVSGTWCLDENERLSPGQMEEIDRVERAYPHLVDEADDGGVIKEIRREY